MSFILSCGRGKVGGRRHGERCVAALRAVGRMVGGGTVRGELRLEEREGVSGSSAAAVRRHPPSPDCPPPPSSRRAAPRRILAPTTHHAPPPHDRARTDPLHPRCRRHRSAASAATVGTATLTSSLSRPCPRLDAVGARKHTRHLNPHALDRVPAMALKPSAPPSRRCLRPPLPRSFGATPQGPAASARGSRARGKEGAGRRCMRAHGTHHVRENRCTHRAQRGDHAVRRARRFLF